MKHERGTLHRFFKNIILKVTKYYVILFTKSLLWVLMSCTFFVTQKIQGQSRGGAGKPRTVELVVVVDHTEV